MFKWLIFSASKIDDGVASTKGVIFRSSASGAGGCKRVWDTHFSCARTGKRKSETSALARECCRRTKNVISVGIIIISLSRVRFSHRAHNGASLLWRRCWRAHTYTHIGEKPQSEREREAVLRRYGDGAVHHSRLIILFIARHVYIWVAPDNNKSLLSLWLRAQKMTRRVQLYAHSSSLSAYTRELIYTYRPPCAERDKSRAQQKQPPWTRALLHPLSRSPNDI